MEYGKKEFERLYKDNYRMLYRLAFVLTESQEDAHDAVSQVFTQLWQKKPEVADDAMTGYLLAATRNQCLHLLRQRQLQREMQEELAQRQETRMNLEHEELMAALKQVINSQLTEQDRRILALHYDEEFTYSETAEALGISYSAVNKHITRSLFKIRRAIGKAE